MTLYIFQVTHACGCVANHASTLPRDHPRRYINQRRKRLSATVCDVCPRPSRPS